MLLRYPCNPLTRQPEQRQRSIFSQVPIHLWKGIRGFRTIHLLTAPLVPTSSASLYMISIASGILASPAIFLMYYIVNCKASFANGERLKALLQRVQGSLTIHVSDMLRCLLCPIKCSNKPLFCPQGNR